MLTDSLTAWVRAVRLQYYPTTFLTLLVGLSVAHYCGIENTTLIIWMVAGNVLLHCASSLINEYRDFTTGADLVDYPETTWRATGGSRVLVDQLITPRDALNISLFFFFVSCGIWGFMGFQAGPGLGVGLLFSLGVTYVYSAAVSVCGFYYVREVLMTFGAVPVFVVSVVKILSGNYSGTAFIAGTLVGMQMMNYLLYHGLIDMKADLESGKLRLTRFLGERNTLRASIVLITGTFVIIGVAVCLNVLPPGCALTGIVVPLAGRIVHDEVKRINIVKNYSKVVLLFLGTGLLLSAGFWLHSL